MGRVINSTGIKFGKLTALYRDKNDKFGCAVWVCKCDCGGQKTVSRGNLSSGNVKSCGCLVKDITTNRNRLRPFEGMYNTFKKYSRHFVNLTYEGFLKFTNETKCHYCGCDIVWKKYRGQRYNLDRKDNAKGYSEDNCVVCCRRCNTGKGHLFTYEEWKKIGDLIRSWKK